MKSSEIRQKFLDFFEAYGHVVVPSSPLVPGNDPTLLFTNAGMVQFKDVFLGQDKRSYVRAVSAQRCVRAGGKHNDLENVGYTARHHTFFEMLGNFSFGDYFKRNAILFAWEFLTGSLNIPKDRLWATVYAEDDEAADIWLNEVGITPSRMVRIATSDNFWQMGDTGPCGPCSEIFYDHGPEIAGGPPGSEDADGDRYVEIWNLVFMQYNRDASGELHSLPKPSVDTGMGLERIAAVMQQVHSNYEIDLFRYLIEAAARVTGEQDLSNNSLKVIADHIRACAFLIADGVIPDNEGRGYVLRRILRRAIRHGYRLGQKQPFFYLLVDDLADVMGQAYPELMAARKHVAGVIRQEEERFAETLDNGMEVLEAALSRESDTLSGDIVFRLYDTFGFPVDLTADIVRERGIGIDLAGFEVCMAQQRDRARASGKFTMQTGLEYIGLPTEFCGYETLQHEAHILALYKGGSRADFIEAGEEAVVVLDQTPFYAESGGQAGDSGELLSGGGTFTVKDTRKIQAKVFGHTGVLTSGRLVTGDQVIARVDPIARINTAYNHSATHLLHAALRQVLGKHVTQKGSLVDADRLRFDFSHNSAMQANEIDQVENLVNAQIRKNHEVATRSMAYDEAVKQGAMALFGEKYGDTVRVVSMGDFSTELCGGTHVGYSGDIGFFRIVAESGVAAGIRRIEALTGEAALAYTQQQEQQLQQVSDVLKAAPHEAALKLSQMLDHIRQMEKEIVTLRSKLASMQSASLVEQVQEIKGVRVLATALENVNIRTLRETLDNFKSRLKPCVVVLGTIEGNKVMLITGVTDDLTKKLKAGDLINFVAQQVGGKGGGRADMAQAGGTLPEKLPQALASVADWVERNL
ncbi:alanine--tRNA ligase [Nitrosomonas sp. HPC101]|uniref:alanine--tRNA ligase n=1 Tax=Nitrosomonas sp. HPC101 TaxID=1658667 RepID=UPI00136C285E|nr:alanine--tRNA ligase [Nitrosomonas sp. HPC101]MXS85133.1 alanine--tRNA ligase [Nitrosomonas sp. HPC101]